MVQKKMKWVCKHGINGSLCLVANLYQLPSSAPTDQEPRHTERQRVHRKNRKALPDRIPVSQSGEINHFLEVCSLFLIFFRPGNKSVFFCYLQHHRNGLQ